MTDESAQPGDKVCKQASHESETSKMGRDSRERKDREREKKVSIVPDIQEGVIRREVKGQLTLLSANSSFCCRSGHTVVTSGSRRSSQSTNSPQLRPDLVTSDLLEEEERERSHATATVKTLATQVPHKSSRFKETKQKGRRETNPGCLINVLLISQGNKLSYTVYIVL